jgi:hypothetical protein
LIDNAKIATTAPRRIVNANLKRSPAAPAGSAQMIPAKCEIEVGDHSQKLLIC